MAYYYIVQYNTSVEQDPPAIRSTYTNSTIFTDINKIQLSWEDKDGLDITGWIFSFEEGDYIELSNGSDESQWGIYRIILLTNNTDSPSNPYVDMEVAPVQMNGTEYVTGQDLLFVSHYVFEGDGTSGTSGTSGVDGSSGTSGTSGTSPQLNLGAIISHLEAIVVELKSANTE